MQVRPSESTITLGKLLIEAVQAGEEDTQMQEEDFLMSYAQDLEEAGQEAPEYMYTEVCFEDGAVIHIHMDDEGEEVVEFAPYDESPEFVQF